jgi:hypothetical protein
MVAEVESYAKKHPKKLIHQLRSRLSVSGKDEKMSTTKGSSLEGHSSEVGFTSVCDIDPADTILV